MSSDNKDFVFRPGRIRKLDANAAAPLNRIDRAVIYLHLPDPEKDSGGVPAGDNGPADPIFDRDLHWEPLAVMFA